MPAKSKRSSKKSEGRKKADASRLDRPVEQAILRRAAQIATSYQIILHFEEGSYFGRGLEMPFVMSDGTTPDRCVENTRDAMTAAVAVLLEGGESPPAPAAEHRRTEQINIRLTREEKLMLEQSARSKGFRGLGDYVRSTTLARCTD